MLRSLRAAVAGFGLMVSGCAIHPLPEDVTGVSTPDIVRRIRCETREAIVTIGLDWLVHQKEDPEARRLGEAFRSGERDIATFHYKLFHGDVRRILQLFFDTGIAYNYSLEMRETNAVAAGLGLVKPFNNGTGLFGLSSGADLQRQNLRTFTVTDSFSKLVRDLRQRDCNGQIAGPNYAYPITGQIGMYPVVHDFVYLTLFNNLAGAKDGGKGPPTLVDALDFQTTLSVSGGPKFVFAPIGQSFGVADAGLTATASRRDTHRVIVGLALPNARIQDALALRDGLVPQLLTARGGPSERVAADAVNQVLTRQALRPVFALTP